MRSFRATSTLVFVCLLLTACGARLTAEQREFALRSYAGGGDGGGSIPPNIATGGEDTTGSAGGPASPPPPGGATTGSGGSGGSGSGTTGSAGTGTTGASGSTGSTGTSGTTGSGTTATTGSGTSGTTGTSTTATTGTATTGTTGSGTSGTTDGGSTGSGTTGSGSTGSGSTGSGSTGSGSGSSGTTGSSTTTTGDTRPAPPGGNGGATDVGVTEDAIVVANVSDITGAVPGLFEDAQLAVKAYLAYFQAYEGTVYGRAFQFRPLDSRLDTNGNREKYIDACETSFAAVGSMSAFEQGAVPVIAECPDVNGDPVGLPDIRTAAVTEELMNVEQVFPADASTPGLQPMAEYNFWAEQAPEAIGHAAYLFIDADTTRFQTAQVRDATAEIGYVWDMYQPIGLSETNYSPYVLEMEDKGIQFVTFQGAYQQAGKLAQAMQQQGFVPVVYALQSNTYTPDFIESYGAYIQGVQIAVPSVILEEADNYPELQQYAFWLDQVAPGESPTGLGMYAWSASKLFIDTVKAVGPELTRAKVLAALAEVEDFTGNDLLPPQDIGSKYPTDCVVIVEIQDSSFVRVEPASGFRCDDHVIDLR